MVLTVNAGSSSLKFAAFEDDTTLARGQVENLGAKARLKLRIGDGPRETQDIGTVDHAGALQAALTHLAPVMAGRRVEGVGHRVVHGGPDHDAPAEMTCDVVAALPNLEPLHQPYNIAGIHAARAAFPDALQLGCFDTSFHRTHPWVHDTYGLPRRYYDQGIRRYGFHGLSYTYIAGHLAAHFPDLAAGRVIVAHLGNGASLCAIKAGQSVSSTMGFSALDGLAMGTRVGQIDPGVLLHLMRSEGMDAQALSDLLYRESGLRGLSGETHDMRALEASGSAQAEQAIAYYTARIRHEIGALAADLGGLDGLVFTGGIGENSERIRQEVCGQMGWLGVTLNPQANTAGVAEIGAGDTRVLVIPTKEEKVIARAVYAALGAG